MTAHEWLLPRLNAFDHHTTNSEPWYLFAHCTEKTKLPNAEKEWGAIFQHFGAVLNTVAVGCCGMAGTFGHESDKLQMSKDIYGLSWKGNLDVLPKERCLVTGYSCRSQVKRFENVKTLHPVQALLRHLD
ncbi:Fe-S protein homolog of lactate dehydrogenase SO1521 [Vibrio astriarenae]|nr:Fe-S protein homolog of lactate dehydrogenase SO1521 [Vibrio sp. C7]